MWTGIEIALGLTIEHTETKKNASKDAHKTNPKTQTMKKTAFYTRSYPDCFHRT